MQYPYCTKNLNVCISKTVIFDYTEYKHKSNCRMSGTRNVYIFLGASCTMPVMVLLLLEQDFLSLCAGNGFYYT